IITTAKLFGRKAPRLIERSAIENMKPGSIIVDMAADSGGNVDGSVLNEEIEINGVKIIAYENLPGMIPDTASQMYSSNLFNLVDEFWDKEEGGSKEFKLDLEDDIIKGALLTHGGEVVNEFVKSIWEKS
ncbi:MAG: NAD(P)(+) transhydrogenase (Re/Si-specific) subunit alpha, partial [Lentisphaeria bacterium]|nr:NAD(P)(+) transhydrogenase (Re/Si-specific) subunit alpha [Lentisphaeria bacterium]